MISVVTDERPTDSRLRSDRRMLWIDGVGGFLIIPGDEWLIGGPGSGTSVEINIQGDLSRRAAAIRRQGGDYVLQPFAEARVGNQSLDRPALLHSGDQFQLGGSVKLSYQKTHPLSASARLDIVTRHRTEPRADGIILLADTCVIGPSKGAHIACPQWQADAILFVSGGSWYIRSDEQINLNGSSVGQRTELSAPCRIEGESMAMSLEMIQ